VGGVGVLGRYGFTTLGDLLRGGVGGTPTRIPIAAAGKVLTVVDGIPQWGTPPVAIGGPNVATAAAGATATDESLIARPEILDVNDATAISTNAWMGTLTAAFIVSLAAIETIRTVRVLQVAAGVSNNHATSYEIATAAAAGGPWTVLVAAHAVGADDETFTVTATAARYWRLRVLAGETFGWNVFTLELKTI